MAHMALDLTGYFARIGYDGAADPTFDVLQDLVTAHTHAIAFENLDPLLGVPVDDLSPEALFDKLVHRRRGGYCYEHNGLMGYVLQELGFGVRRFAARVVWTTPPGSPVPSQTHTLLGVAPRARRNCSSSTWVSAARRRRRRCGWKRAAPSRRRMSHTGCRAAATFWCCRPKFAASGNRCTNSPPGQHRRSICRWAAGMSPLTRRRISSPT